MKVKNKFKFFLASLMFATMFVSCGSDDGPAAGGGGNGDATSITLTADAENVFLDGQVAFTVMDDLGNNVTSESTIRINNNSVTNPYIFTQLGTFDVTASYSGLTSNAVTVNVQTEADLSLFFSANPATTAEMVTFTTTNSLGEDVTSETTFSLDGSAITNPYQFSNTGVNTVEASYNGFTASEDITITRNFTKKALLEDFTGTWCPNCPPAASAIASAINDDNVFGVSYHDGVSGYPDPMEIPETAFWSSYYNVTGFPTVYVNGPDTRWNFPNMTQVNNELAEIAPCGLALDASMSGGQLNVEVKVAFSNFTAGEELRLMLYLVEDNVVTSSPQAGSSQGASYVHRDVLREVYTDQLGDIIPTASISLEQDYVRTFTGLAIPANVDDMSNLKVIAYVRNTYTKTFVDYFNETHENSPHYDILNVQEVEMGGSIDFD